MTTSADKGERRGRPSRASIYVRFARAIEELSQYGGLPAPDDAKPLWDALWHLEAHHSTALEGNTLVLREVEQLLDQGRAVGSKELREYLEVLGYADAACWVYAQAASTTVIASDELLTVTEVRRVHELAMANVWQVSPHPAANAAESPGGFREHDIRPFANGVTPPSHAIVAAEVACWVDSVSEFAGALADGTLGVEEIPEVLAKMHAAFERIHPFIDGNGRTGRLLLNLVLLRLGWPPAIIFKEQRQRYLRALDRADHGDYAPLGELIARSVIDNLHRLIPNLAGAAEYVPLEALVDDEFSLAALKQAATRGRLAAIIGSDGRYQSSRAAVEAYKASKYSRSTK